MTKALWLFESVLFVILIAACVSCDSGGRSVSASSASASFGSPPNVGPRSVAEMRAALAKSGSRPLLLLVNRAGRNISLTVRPKAGAQ